MVFLRCCFPITKCKHEALERRIQAQSIGILLHAKPYVRHVEGWEAARRAFDMGRLSKWHCGSSCRQSVRGGSSTTPQAKAAWPCTEANKAGHRTELQHSGAYSESPIMSPPVDQTNGQWSRAIARNAWHRTYKRLGSTTTSRFVSAVGT